MLSAEINSCSFSLKGREKSKKASSASVKSDVVIFLEQLASQLTFRMTLWLWGDFLPWKTGEDVYATL